MAPRSLIRGTTSEYGESLYGGGALAYALARLDSEQPPHDRHTEALPMLEVGTPAPDFTLKSHENEEITLSSFKGDKWVVLHTFPAAFTGG